MKSSSYRKSDDPLPNRTEHPIPAPGIGRRLAEISDVIGTRTSASEVMGVSAAALQRYIREENVPPFDATARLCLAANARMEWLATGKGEMLASPPTATDQSQVLSQDELTIAVQLAAEALDDRRSTLPPAKFAELVTIIFELLRDGLPEAKVLRLARAMGDRKGG